MSLLVLENQFQKLFRFWWKLCKFQHTIILIVYVNLTLMLAAYLTNNNPSELAGWNTNYWNEGAHPWSFFLLLQVDICQHTGIAQMYQSLQVTRHLCVMEQAVADILNLKKEKKSLCIENKKSWKRENLMWRYSYI